MVRKRTNESVDNGKSLQTADGRPAGDALLLAIPEQRYDSKTEIIDLLRPLGNGIDADIALLTQRYKKQNVRVRSRFRKSLSDEERWQLVNFSRRASVLALREKSVDRIVQSLTALAMLEDLDPRDLLMALAWPNAAAAIPGRPPRRMIP